MATTTMTLSNADWTRDEIVKSWLGSEPQAVAQDAADTEIAYLINNVSKRLSGWTYRDGQFSGPARTDALDTILALITEAADDTIAKLDEIRADATS